MLDQAQVKAQDTAVYVLSAERSELPNEENDFRTGAMHRALTFAQAKFKGVHGVYKGTSESAFVVNAETVTFGTVLAMARNFGQETILYVGKR